MKRQLFEYPEGKTNYQIINENNEKTTITLEKWVADVLQTELADVHERIQSAYNRVCLQQPNLTRRERGSLIRQMSKNTARAHQITMKQVLGWNDEDIRDSL